MEKKNCLTLSKEFLDFCRLNDKENIEKYAEEVFNIGFNVVKYGAKFNMIREEEKIKPKIESLKENKVEKIKKDIYGE